MYYKTRLNIISIISVIIIIIFGAVVILAFQEIDQEIQHNIIAEEIVAGVFELNIITGDFLLHQEERDIEQFHARHDSLEDLMNSMVDIDLTDEAILVDLQENLNDLNDFFVRISEEDNSKELEESLISRMRIKSLSMVSDSNQLSAHGRENIASAEQRSLLFVFVFVVGLVGVVAGNFYYFARIISEREKLEDNMLRSGKLAAIGQFAGSIGHDLRNPLGVIGNSAYYLNLKLQNADEKVTKHLDIIQNEVKVSSRMISDLLDFARVKPLLLQENDLNQVIKQTLAIIELPKNISIETKLDSKIPRILLDRDRIQRAFWNIVNNAVEAMPEGGKLTISSTAENGFVVLRISDTGGGISKENLEHLFEPLFTTKSRGTGLGLAVVTTSIEAHNGKIEVESKIKEGTTVTIKLPQKKGVDE